MDKKLYRIEEGKMIAGVCGGLAEYFNMDITLMRVLWIVACLMCGTGVIAYIIMAIIVPVKSVALGTGNSNDKKEN